MRKPVTITDVQNMNEEELAALHRQAAINIASFIALKIGIAVSVHYAVKRLVANLDAVNN